MDEKQADFQVSETQEATPDNGSREGFDRRTLLSLGGRGLAAALLASGSPAANAQASATVPAVDRGVVHDGTVRFPPIEAETDPPSSQPPDAEPKDQRIGFAIVGLGRLSLEQILPAFSGCKHARPAALVSGDAAKAKLVAAQYGIERTFSYADFEQLAQLPEVQAVYIVLPNSMHREFTERAAKIGKHVLTEKPMTVSSADAQAMIDACASAHVRLMVAYRIQYEHTNRYLQQMVRSGALGTIRSIHAMNVQDQSDPDQWRQIRALSGGGSLPDIGLYCLNTVRALLGEEPRSVSAVLHSPPGDPRFRQVEDLVSFTLTFPSGVVASCTSCYSAHKHSELQVMGVDAWARVASAFNYDGQKLTVSRREGIAELESSFTLSPAKQFALELDHFAECIRDGREPRTGGPEGLQDQKLMEAIYAAARSGSPVELPVVRRLDSTRGPALPPLSSNS